MYQKRIDLKSIDESLRTINYEAKKRKGTKKNSSLYTNLKESSAKCGVPLCVEQCWEKSNCLCINET